MTISNLLISLFFFINFHPVAELYKNLDLLEKANFDEMSAFVNEHFDNSSAVLSRFGGTAVLINARQKKNYPGNPIDSLPKTINDTVVVPFVYKQSALNYSYTFRLIDSAIEILTKNEKVTLSIDGYSYFDEGNDFICYWLSINRALAVKYYVQGRGVDSSRIITTEGLSSLRSVKRKAVKQPVEFNCTAEIILNYPVPPPLIAMQDVDEDGIPDNEDSCKNDFGDKAHNGCPDKNAIIVPFELQESSLISPTYIVLDSVVNILRNDPSITIFIEGHAYKKEGVEKICDQLAKDRADIVRRYLLSRHIAASKIDSIKSYGNLRPLNAGRNPWEIARNSRAEIFLVHH